MNPTPVTSDRPVKELMRDFTNDSMLLMRQEIELAKRELSVQVQEAKKDAAATAVGGAVLYAGFLVLLGAVVLALGTAMAFWVAALIVGLVVSAAGALSAMKGLKGAQKIDPVPHQALTNMKTDIRTIKEAAR